MNLLETYKIMAKELCLVILMGLLVILGITLFVIPFVLTGVLIDNGMPFFFAPFFCCFAYFLLIGVVDHYEIFWENGKDK